MSSAYEQHNRAFWEADADDYQATHGEHLSPTALQWGVWGIPEADLGVLPDVKGMDVLELGCGGAQDGRALTHLGANVVGLDLSMAQLRHARHTELPLALASAEHVPFKAAAFDLVLSHHGAMSFCEPRQTVAEAARLLRSGGYLICCTGSHLLYITWDAEREKQSRRLQSSYFETRGITWVDGTHDFTIPVGEWVRLFRAHDFVIEDLIELQAPTNAATTYADYVPKKWAQRWPAEQIWKVRKA